MEIVIKLYATEALELAKTLELTSGHKEKWKYSDDMYKALSWALNCLVHGKGGPMPPEAVDIAGSYRN